MRQLRRRRQSRSRQGRHTMSASPAAGRRKAPAPRLLVLVTISGTLAMHMFVPALPDAARVLQVGSAAMQMTISVYIMGLAGGQLAYGPLSDAFGRRGPCCWSASHCIPQEVWRRRLRPMSTS